MQIDLSLENAGADTLAGGVTTFGQVFTRGDVSANGGLVANVNGVDIPVQMDVKTTYDDGSVKMAVLSLVRPDLPAGSNVNVSLSATASATAGAPIDLASALDNHSFTVDLSGGQTASVDVLAALKQALADGTASYWQSGPLATQARVEIPLEGSQRLVFDVTAYEGGGMSVEAQFNNDVAMSTNGGAVSYDVTVNMDGHIVAQQSVNQAQYQNWHQSFSSNELDGGQGLGDASSGWLNIQHDVGYLQQTGAVAHYDLNVGIADSLIAEYTAAMQGDGWGQPLAVNGITQYMPGTGGRADIGFTTEANTAWLMSQNAQVAAYALDQAETASAVTWHLYDSANSGWVSTQDYPKLWTDERGGTGTPGDAASGGLTQQIGISSGWELDSAHQPDLSYVPYLLTGERWMLDNLNAQASWNIVAQYPDVRGAESMIVVDGNQVRGAAWALRQIDAAAWAAPDGSAEKAYFTAASEANWSWLVSKIPEWTAQQGEAHGYLPGEYGVGGAMPPWQQDYFASTVIAAASRGNADALTFLEWQSNFLVGRFTHQAEGFDEHDGAAYLIAIADANGTPYQTWSEIGAQTDANGWSNNDGWANSQGDYAQLALATLSGIAHLTGSAEAAAAYDALMADNPPFASATDFARDPTYALAAPGSDNTASLLPSTPAVTTPVDTGSDTTTDPSTEVPVADNSGSGDTASGDVATGDTGSVGSGSSDTGSSDVGSGDTGTGDTATGDTGSGDIATGGDTGTGDTASNGTDTGDSTTPPSTGTSDQAPVAELPDAAGMVDLAIRLGSEAWDGNAQAIVRVNGTVAFEGEVTASHADGGAEINLGQVLADGVHSIEVQYVNDAWGGSYEADRNLHVEDLTLAGVSTGESTTLFDNGTVTFSLQVPQDAVDAYTASTDPSHDLVQSGVVNTDQVFIG